MRGWLFGPLLAQWPDGTNYNVAPVTTSIDNLASVADLLGKQIGPCIIEATGRTGRLRPTLDQLRNVFNLEEHERETIVLTWGQEDNPLASLSVYRSMPACFWAHAQYVPAIRSAAELLTRESQRRIPSIRIALALRIALRAITVGLIAAAFAVNPDRTWLITLLASFGALTFAAWGVRQIDERWMVGDKARHHDRLIVHHRSRQQVIEDRVTTRAKLRIGTLNATAGGVVGVIGTYFAAHR